MRYGIMVVALGAALAAEGARSAPLECGALETWAASVDGEDRVMPVEGSRTWVPRAFFEPGFAELFGRPATEFTRDQAREVSGRLFDCGQEAGEAGRRPARDALYGARRWFSSALAGVLNAQRKAEALAAREAEREARRQAREAAAERRREEARAQARQRRADASPSREASREPARSGGGEDGAGRGWKAELERLLAASPAPEALRSLWVLSRVPFPDERAYAGAQGLLGPDGAAVMEALRTMPDAERRPLTNRLAARRNAMADTLSERWIAEMAELPATRAGLERLGAIARQANRQVQRFLGEARAEAVRRAMIDRHAAMLSVFAGRATSHLDAAAGSRGAPEARLAAVDRALGGIDRTLFDRETWAKVEAHAAALRAGLAEEGLSAAVEAMAARPPTPEGLAGALGDFERARAAYAGSASEEGLARFRARAAAALKAGTEAALPELRRRLSGLPDTQAGLEGALELPPAPEARAALPEGARTAWTGALDARLAEIRAGIAETRAARRDDALAAGGDPDLVGRAFEDREHATRLEFVDESRGVMQSLGLRFPFDYALLGDEVEIIGRNGTMLLRRVGGGEGLRLEGMGLRLERAE